MAGADLKISEMPGAVTLTGAELVPVVQSGVNDRTTTQDIANLGRTLLSGPSKLLGTGTADTGSAVEIVLGTNLSMTGRTLNATGGGGSGTVSNFAFTNGGGFTGTVANPTTTPTLSLTYSPAFASLTTTGSGAATLVSGVLNIPTPTAGGSGTVTSFSFSNGNGFTGTVSTATTTPVLSLSYSPSFASLTTSGTGASTLSGGVLNVPTPVVQSLTTTGSGAASLSAGVLNIPTPSPGGTGTVTSFTFTNGNGFTGTVNTATTTPTLLLSYAPAFASLTTTGSGAATLSGGVLNIPTPNSSGGTVTSVSATGTRVTGTVTNSTTTPSIALALANTTVTPGSYTNASLTVQADGTLTAASSGSMTQYALTANPLSQFASTTSAQFAGVISDATGTGSVVFGTGPTLTNAVVGTQSAGDNSTKAASTAYADRNIFTGGTLTSALNEAPSVTLASASTVNVGAAAANTVNISGTTTINGFDVAPDGIKRTTLFLGTITLNYNATSFKLTGQGSITTSAGDIAEWESNGGGNWRMIDYIRLSGSALTATSTATTQAANNNSVSIATTAFAQISSGRILSAVTISSGVLTIPVSGADFNTVTLTANVTSISLTNLYPAGFINKKWLKITQGASTAFTVAWPASFKWPGGVAGTVSTALGAVDELEIHSYDGGTTWEATLTKAFA